MVADLWVTGMVATAVMTAGLTARATPARRRALARCLPWLAVVLAIGGAAIALAGDKAVLAEWITSAGSAFLLTVWNQPAAVFGGLAIGFLALPWLRLNFSDTHDEVRDARYRMLTLALAVVMASAVLVPLAPRIADRLAASQRLDIDMFGLKLSTIRGAEAGQSTVYSLARAPEGGNGRASESDLVVRGIASLRSISLAPSAARAETCDDAMLAKVRALSDPPSQASRDEWLDNPKQWPMRFPEGDPFDGHLMARDWIFALYVEQRTKVKAQAVEDEQKELAAWAMAKPSFVAIMKPMTEAFCFFQELNKVLLCVEDYVKFVPDHRLVLIDMHQFIRALVIFVRAEGDGTEALKALEGAGARLNGQVRQVFEEMRPAEPPPACAPTMELTRGPDEARRPRFELNPQLPYLAIALANLLASVGSYDSAITTLLHWHESYAIRQQAQGEQLRRGMLTSASHGLRQAGSIQAAPLPPTLATWVRVRSATEISRLVEEAASPILHSRVFRDFLDDETAHLAHAVGLGDRVALDICNTSAARSPRPAVNEVIRQNLTVVHLTHRADLIRRKIESDAVDTRTYEEARRFQRFDPACFPMVAQLQSQGAALQARFRLTAAEASLAALDKPGIVPGMTASGRTAILEDARRLAQDAFGALDSHVVAESRNPARQGLRVSLLSPSAWEQHRQRAEQLARRLAKVAEAR